MTVWPFTLIAPFLALATLSTEGHPELIAVTDAVSAGGKHSLKVQDRPDLQAVYNPHFYLDPHYSKGTALFAYKIRLESAADAMCEWRDQASPYRTGPTIQFRNGVLSTRGKKLMDIPMNGWISVEMRCPVGKSDPRWSLKATLPNGTSQTFDDLPCDPGWKEVRWLGFSSNARNTASFYLDDVVLENK